MTSGSRTPSAVKHILWQSRHVLDVHTMHLMSNVFDALDVEQIASTSAPKFADVVHFKSIRDNISTSSVLFWRQLFFTSKPISGIERICRRLVIVNLARWGSSLIKGAEEPVSNSLRSILRLFDVLFRICLFFGIKIRIKA